MKDIIKAVMEVCVPALASCVVVGLGLAFAIFCIISGVKLGIMLWS